MTRNPVKSPPAAAGAKRRLQTAWRQKQLYLMLLPALVLILLFTFVPLFGWVMAFTDYRPGIGMFEAPRAGERGSVSAWPRYAGRRKRDMYKVLIADDDPAVREGLPLLIDWCAAGFQVTAAAENGRQALDLLRAGSFDLAVTDIRMPGMDGITLARENRQLPVPCKMVLLSGYGEFGYAQEAIRCGVYRYLLKPVGEEQLLKLLNELREELRKERAPRPAAEGAQAESVQLARTLEPVIGYIQDHCAEKLSLQELAGRFYLNPAYLGRIFKKYTGYSCQQYLIGCRMELAKRLLRQGTSVTEAAGLVSYEDVDHFARLFRLSVGMSPSEYRSGRGRKQDT